jgi:hypothetical protein
MLFLPPNIFFLLLFFYYPSLLSLFDFKGLKLSMETTQEFLRLFENIIGKERRLYEYHVSDVKAPTGAAMPDNGSDDIPYCTNTKTKRIMLLCVMIVIASSQEPQVGHEHLHNDTVRQKNSPTSCSLRSRHWASRMHICICPVDNPGLSSQTRLGTCTSLRFGIFLDLS